MPTFTSTREKRFWGWSLMVVAAIFATLFMGRPLANQLRDQEVQAAFFVIGLLLVGAAIFIHALIKKPGSIEFSVLLGIVAVYVMLIFRLGAPERSHLIEYSVLSICIHKALIERALQGKQLRSPALLAIGLACLIGLADEVIQVFLPNRVFDPQDLLFNAMAVTMAVGSHALMSWVRKKRTRLRGGNKGK